MKHSCFLLMMMIYSSASIAQRGIPANHRIQRDESGMPQLLRTDLDGDGKRDSVMIIEKEARTDGRIFVLLSSQRSPVLSAPIGLCCGSLTLNKNVIVAITRGMRGFGTFRFRWEPVTKDFRLIGYDTESYGTASGDGSGKASLNLLNGAYEGAFFHWDVVCAELAPLPPVKRTLKLNRKIYLSHWSEESEQWLYDVMNAQLSAAMR
jgi:hypothetical protein